MVLIVLFCFFTKKLKALSKKLQLNEGGIKYSLSAEILYKALKFLELKIYNKSHTKSSTKSVSG